MPSRRFLAAAVAAALVAPATALASTTGQNVAPVQPWLAASLSAAADTATHRVFVHADRTATAEQAAERAGLVLVERFDAVGVVVAHGTTAAVEQVVRQPGVTYVEGDLPVVPLLDRVHRATRNDVAQRDTFIPNQGQLSGLGVSVAVVDTGVDGTHPFFRTPESGSRVVVNLKSVCHNAAAILLPGTPLAGSDSCWVPVVTNDSDTGSMAGHGTHVAGIVAGAQTATKRSVGGAPRTLSGVAPQASVVALSIGQAASVYGSYSAFHWLVEHHRAPCGVGVSARACPPVRVVNNSYGSLGGSRFDPGSVITKLQRRLVAEGVVVVYAAGNDDGDGSGRDAAGRVQGTNGPGNDPTPGVLMVASYDDRRKGGRDEKTSDFSSRGTKGMPGTYPDLSAPGSGITSSCREHMPLCVGIDPHDGPGNLDKGTFDTLSGTSMASPYVAGVVAELLQLEPRLTPSQVEAVLEDSAYRFAAGAPYEDDPSNPGSPTSYDKGHGLVDVAAAVAGVQAGVRGLPGEAPAGGTAGAAPVRVPPPPYTTRKDLLSCRTAFVDDKGDADDLYVNGAPNRPSLDLLAGRWEWDGEEVTAVLVVDDLASLTRTIVLGEYFSWKVTPAGGDPFSIIGSLASKGSYLSRSTATLNSTSTIRMEAVDKPGTGSDEVRLSFGDDQLRALQGRNPVLSRSLALTTNEVIASQQVGFVPLQADIALGGSCPYRIGAADRLKPGR